MNGLGLIFLIPGIFILVLLVLALCKVASRADCADEVEPETYQQPVVDVFNPPGPRYL